MNRTASGVVVACLLLGVVSTGMVPAAAVASGADAHIDGFAYSGDGNVTTPDGQGHLWQSAAHRFTVTVSSGSGVNGSVCLVAAPTGTGGERELACEPATVSANGSATVEVRVGEWPANLTGAREVRALVHPANSSDVLANASVRLTVIERDGDLDGDGLTNEREASAGTELRRADTDGDGLSDGEEVKTYGTLPTAADTDDDGLSDRAEIRTHRTDPTTADTDDDGLPDRREVTLGTNPNKADSDGDGVNDALEANTYETDPTAPDTDGDGLDDGVEIDTHQTNPTRADTDGDGLNDALEVNTYGTDPNEVDTDGDGIEDGTEVSQYQTDPAAADTDGDGLADGREVNAYDTNPTNADTDGDGLQDGAEVNRHGTDPTNADTDGDGQSDRAEVRVAGTGPLVAGIAVVVLVAAAWLLSRSDRGDLPFGWIGRGGDDDTPADREGETEADAEATGATGGTGSVTGEEKGEGPDRPAEDVPSEFLSNENRVLRLLDENDGQMRQADIVEETGWSKSKVSRVLSEMADDGQVVKIEVGRSNIVARPDDLPPGAGSPFEE